MKKKIPFIILYVLTAVVTVANVVYSVRDSMFFTLDDLPVGTHLMSVNSPDRDKTLSVYCVSNSLGTAVRAAVSDGDRKAENVFWQVDLDAVDCNWISNSVVQINDVMIDVENGGTYDCRRGYSLFREGSLEGQDQPVIVKRE